ncbi:hypothetical protein GJAV_G00213720 [Gymnothorax javanicus]|nr:hypothetical protein GJAV_G00213720 [Gymnothorax javanicus]
MSQTLLILLAAAVFFHGSVTVTGAENCKDYGIYFERAFTVPGEAAVLNCSLAIPAVFDLDRTPYNISWYDGRTGMQLSDRLGQFRVTGTMLWFLNSTLEDAGQYECILRTADRCFKQRTVLRVDPPVAGSCGLPHFAPQTLVTEANGNLVCPLFNFINHADSYTIKWYKDCEPVLEGGKFSLVQGNRLLLRHVTVSDAGHYTCRITFNLTGSIGHAAETIDCDVKDEWIMRPIMFQPQNETVKAERGGHFNKTCKVFVPSRGNISVDVIWATEEDKVSNNASHRVHQARLRNQKVDDGQWLELLLNFTEVKEEDLNQYYTCMVFSDKGVVYNGFSLLPSDPSLMVPLLLLFVGLALTSFHLSEGSDDKAYDAYVVYPRMCWNGFQGCAETFVIHTLPQVLEKKCGYKLFIHSRDSLPGEAVVDSVRENICKSLRVILLYTASTFTSLGSPLRFEQEIGMHVALVEGTLQVILIELEEVTDYSLFPESVLHLKSKHGAIQWWKTSGKMADRSQLCPSSRFWKQVRYRMPVKAAPVSSSPKLGCWVFSVPR